MKHNKFSSVTIIIPCRNEEDFIEGVINNMLSQDYPKELLNIYIIDGCSTDKTQEIVLNFSKEYNYIKLLINPHKTVPYALNIGITNATSQYIVILGAHCKYESNYISSLISTITQYNADNVGGVLNTLPGDSSKTAKAISLATSCKFGVGNSYFRVGVSKIHEVDTVPFGCFKSDVFKKIGLFDVDLTRNQDDEFNARMKKNGLKILLNPDVKIDYFMRVKLKQVAKMFYQYGYFKPLVNKKVGSVTTLRQLAPALLVGYFLSFPITLLYYQYSYIFFFYLAINLYFSFKIMISGRIDSLNTLLLLFIVFILIHTNYGFGYIRGIIDFIVLGRKNNKTIDMSR